MSTTYKLRNIAETEPFFTYEGTLCPRVGELVQLSMTSHWQVMAITHSVTGPEPFVMLHVQRAIIKTAEIVRPDFGGAT